MTGSAAEAERLHGDPVALTVDRLERAADQAARSLLGAVLVRELDGVRVVARIVEAEGYRQDDPASHSYRGNSARVAAMFARAGTAYVYRSYGVHWMLNVSAEAAGTGAAVLLRGASVLAGAEPVRARRPTARDDHGLLRGPGCLAAGLGITREEDGMDLLDPAGGLWLGTDGWEPGSEAIVRGPRVGVSLAADRPWRFHLAGIAGVSRYRRSPRADVDQR
ncbi:MAG: DNA-3-methyladenine glycosylase [Nitriliruptoraceae bacterium]